MGETISIYVVFNALDWMLLPWKPIKGGEQSLLPSQKEVQQLELLSGGDACKGAKNKRDREERMVSQGPREEQETLVNSVISYWETKVRAVTDVS